MSQKEIASQNVRRLAIPVEARRIGKKLLTQQCWCWGQDVKCASGNLLLQYGFERQRPPEGESGATTYSLKLLPNARVALWGFGLWYGEVGQGAVFIGRFTFEVRWSAGAELPRRVWAPPHLDEFVRRACTRSERIASRRLLSRALLWMHEYENWVLRTVGETYRCQCLEKYPHPIAPQIAAQSWKPLSQRVLRARPRPSDSLCELSQVGL